MAEGIQQQEASAGPTWWRDSGITARDQSVRSAAMRSARVAFAWAVVVATGLTSLHGQAPAPETVATLLQRQTTELLDAIAPGNRHVWQQYLHRDLIYTTEDGTTKSKSELIAELDPLPAMITGRLHVTSFRALVLESLAVTNYLVDESQEYFGQTLRSQYRTTDTWVRSGGGWQLVASQVLAVRADPPSVLLPAEKLQQYVGTYELSPGVSYTITHGSAGLVGQRSGRKPESLQAEVADALFVPGQPRLRKIFQRDANGLVTGFVERRESWDILWRRIR
jgi:hypothetical protein